MAGLRRNEVDKLPWAAFRWDEGLIRIEATQFFRPKTIPIRKATSWWIQSYSRSSAAITPGAKSDFVIESSTPAYSSALYDHYRCQGDIQVSIARPSLEGRHVENTVAHVEKRIRFAR